MTTHPRLPRLVLRAIAALLLAAQGVVHLWLWLDGFAGIAVIGPLFLGGAIAALVLAVTVLVTDNVLVLGAGVLLSLGQLAAFATSSTFGLFGFETVWTLTGPEGAALWAELFAAVALLTLARWRHQAQPSPPPRRPAFPEP